MGSRRTSNGGHHDGLVGAVPVELELAALEDLGPKTRYAICNSPIAVLAEPMVRQLIDHNDKIEAENVRRASAGEPQLGYLDPKEPRLDEHMAKKVMELGVNLILKERSLEDALAGVKPLHARRVRLGRRAYR